LLWPLAVMGGSVLTWLLFPVPSFIILPLELKNLALGVIVAAVILSLLSPLVTFNCSSRIAWSWGYMWSLPHFSASRLNLTHLTLAAVLRKIDLTWMPCLSWSPILGVSDSGASNKTEHHTKMFNALFLTGTLLAVVIFIYLCILILLKPWKFKSFYAAHLYILQPRQ
jgi:hypothetical protein